MEFDYFEIELLGNNLCFVSNCLRLFHSTTNLSNHFKLSLGLAIWKMTQQYYPLPQEYLATGIIGALFYCIILYFALLSGALGFRSKSTRRFFAAVMIMSLLELPRFISLAVNQSYTSKITYSIHTIAGIFFFLAYSIVCRQWSGLLQLGSYFRFVYGYHSLIVANVIFAIIDIATVVICLLSSSLGSFFDSTAYEIITFFEGIRNCIYSIFLTYYGLKLIRRFWHFRKLEKQQAIIRQRHQLTTPVTNHNNNTAESKQGLWNTMHVVWCGGGICWQGCFAIAPEQDHIFHGVVFRLTAVLFLSTICFMIRVIMLILKMIALHSHTIHLTTPSFTLFGFWWFLCSDFLPRTVPTLAFIFLMRTKKPSSIHTGVRSGGRKETPVVRSNAKGSEPQLSAFEVIKLSVAKEEEETGSGMH